MPAHSETILILGGTREAAVIAERLSTHGTLRVVTSLAGRTKEPRPVAGEVRIGGFGGAAGLEGHLRQEGVDLVIDATHPFAATISANAAEACGNAGVKRLVFVRPPWEPTPEDRWERVASLEDAADRLPPGARAFLALGHQHLAAFSARKDCAFVVRLMDEPEERLPIAEYDLLVGPPSTDAGVEAEMFDRYAITHMVCRNSGGVGAQAKLVAARQIGLPVIMITRPPPPDGEIHETVDALIEAIGLAPAEKG